MKTQKCPKCDLDDCIVCEEEVDIGVGTQKFLVGYECQKCGTITVCYSCGAPDFKKHENWCTEKLTGVQL